MKVRSIVLGVVVIALALFVWAWPFAGEPPAVGEVHDSPSAQPTAQAQPANGAVERSDAAAIEPAAESKSMKESTDTAPGRVPAYLARFQVVDEADQPVADAVVTVWAAKRASRSPEMEKATGRKGNSYSGRSKTPLLELHTDIQGRAQARLELECVVASASKGELSTGEYSVWNTRAAERETKFVLETRLLLRGIVLHADGRPAGGVRIVVHISGGGILQRGEGQAPEQVDSGPDGRFALPVRAHVGYSLHGELDGTKTFWQSARIHPPRNEEIELRFPGGITLAGVVVDTNGKPVAKAEVMAWREYNLADPKQDRWDSEHEYSDAEADGRFSMPVRRHARYQLVANDGVHANSTVVWIETTPERPHADVRLVLPEFATIKGRVVHGDGTAFPRVVVGAQPGQAETSNGIAMPTLKELFGNVKDVTTGDDGGFVLMVHPGVPWTVRAMPARDNPRHVFEQERVNAGRDDVEVRIGDRELVGCTVHGTVTRPGGQPIGPFQVQVFDWEDDAPLLLRGGDARARIDGDAFTLPALPLGKRFALLVTPGDGKGPRHAQLAPAATAPFVTDRAEIGLEVRVEEWGRFNVQVLNDKALPARGVRVTVLRAPQLGSPTVGGPVDADGRNALWCAPGPHRLQVWTVFDRLTDQELVVTSGINPDVVVRLPAAGGR